MLISIFFIQVAFGSSLSDTQWSFQSNPNFTFTKNSEILVIKAKNLSKQYIKTGGLKSFRLPPDRNQSISLKQNKRYEVSVNGKKQGDISIQFWIIMYDKKKRISHFNFNTNLSDKRSFSTPPNAEYYRLAFRFSGSGSAKISSIEIKEKQKKTNTFSLTKQLLNKNSMQLIAKDGAYCWFQDPRAIRVKNKTFITYITSDGSIIITSINHTDGKKRHFNLHKKLEIDDHDSGGIQVLNDGRIIVFYSKHNDPLGLRYRISCKPQDISCWSDESVIPDSAKEGAATYSNPLILKSEHNRLYIFFRAGNKQPYMAYSDDNAQSWSHPIQYIKSNEKYPYVKLISNGVDTIHFAISETHPTEKYANKSIHYLQYRNGVFSKINGEKLATLKEIERGKPIPIQSTDICFSVDDPWRSWIMDIAIDNKGQPLLLTTTHFESGGNIFYNYVTRENNKWKSNEFVIGGMFIGDSREKFYSGLASFDQMDPKNIFLSRQRYNNNWVIEKWQTQDRGTTWYKEEVSKNIHNKNIRPYIVKNSLENDLHVIWMSGSYTHYTDYNTSIIGYPK